MPHGDDPVRSGDDLAVVETIPLAANQYSGSGSMTGDGVRWCGVGANIGAE